MLPNSGADTLASEPPNLPTAVRAAETMTMSSMLSSFDVIVLMVRGLKHVLSRTVLVQVQWF